MSSASHVALPTGSCSEKGILTKDWEITAGMKESCDRCEGNASSSTRTAFKAPHSGGYGWLIFGRELKAEIVVDARHYAKVYNQPEVEFGATFASTSKS
jgi:hypothetical protein